MSGAWAAWLGADRFAILVLVHEPIFEIHETSSVMNLEKFSLEKPKVHFWP